MRAKSVLGGPDFWERQRKWKRVCDRARRAAGAVGIVERAAGICARRGVVHDLVRHGEIFGEMRNRRRSAQVAAAADGWNLRSSSVVVIMLIAHCDTSIVVTCGISRAGVESWDRRPPELSPASGCLGRVRHP